MTRRQWLLATASTAVAAGDAPRSTMGVATTCYMTVAKPRDTLAFVEHAAEIGAGGVQAALSSLDAAAITRLRDRLRALGMYFEAMIPLPGPGETAKFENSLAAARDAGAIAVRTACLSGRRYETFDTLEDWDRFVAQSHAAIDRALPLVEKYGLPLAVENHKDWTVDEMTQLMAAHRHPLLGVTLDTGNNMSLLDDPIEVVERLAPFAFSTHIKDMDVDLTPDGFLLAEVPFGEGMLDLERIVKVIRAASPKTRFTLEMITREPLRVPCLTEKYWQVFPGRSGSFLAKTLRMVQARAKLGRPQLGGFAALPHEEQAKREEANVRSCLRYATTHLGLG